MILWLVLGFMTLATVALLLRPLLKGSKTAPDREAYDLEVYRDQLVEVAREEARGLLVPEEARAAEREIARRLLSAASAETRAGPASDVPRPDMAAGRTARRWTAFAIVAALPLGALVLYLYVGAPGVPDFPFAGRDQVMKAQGMPEIGEAVARLEARLKSEPNNLEGWLLLARSDVGLGRLPQAVEAYRKAVELSHERPDVVSAYAETLVMQSNGTVGAQAKKLFEQVRAKDPQEARARFYLGLAKVQAGDGEGAVRDWLALEADAPADASWRSALHAQIEHTAQEFKLDLAKLAPPGTKLTPPSTSAPSEPSSAAVAAVENMSPEQRNKMIRSMVERLAARLQQQPDDLDGWRRLGRAYTVLGESDKAAEALSYAAKLAPKDPNVLSDYGQALAAEAKPKDKLPPKAVEVMRRVLALDGERREALWYVGLAEAERGDKAAATTLWSRLLAQLKPGTPEYVEIKEHLDSLGQAR